MTHEVEVVRLTGNPAAIIRLVEQFSLEMVHRWNPGFSIVEVQAQVIVSKEQRVAVFEMCEDMHISWEML